MNYLPREFGSYFRCFLGYQHNVGVKMKFWNCRGSLCKWRQFPSKNFCFENCSTFQVTTNEDWHLSLFDNWLIVRWNTPNNLSSNRILTKTKFNCYPCTLFQCHRNRAISQKNSIIHVRITEKIYYTLIIINLIK